MEIIVPVLALCVSFLGLILSFYVVSKNKPKLVVEKESIEIKKGKNEIWLYFYLSNIGERPAPIKKIEFYNPKTRFMPRTSIINVVEELILGIGEDLPTADAKKYSVVNFPFMIKSHDTKKILGKLNFSTKMQLNKEIKRDKINYKIRISYANKLIEKLI